MAKKKILIAAAGSGGHLYPAQALMQQMLKLDPTQSFLFVGGGLKDNVYFQQFAVPFAEVSYGKIEPASLWKTVKNGWKMLKGILQACRILRAYKPDVIVGFGSYHTFPVLAAAYLLRLPFVLHEANAIPGKVNRCFSKYAIVTGLHFGSAASHLKGSSLEVGMPLRQGYSSSFLSQRQAREYFHLDPDKFTFLVFGGSQGAVALNFLFCSAVTQELAERSKNFQVIHITGNQVAPETFISQYRSEGIAAVVKEFEPRMDMAWRAADLAICRAGAMSIAEQIEMEVPGILIPYPYAADGHQNENADIMALQVKGCIKVAEKELDPSSLANIISELVAEDRKKLNEMRLAIRSYKQRKIRRRDLCSVVSEVAGLKER